MIESENHVIVISDTVLVETTNAHEPRKSHLQELIKLFKAEIIFSNQEAQNLADMYIREKLIHEKHTDDALHIAIATANRCNFIVSWNFKHIVRAKVIMGVHHINHREGYGLIEIVSPNQFLGKRGLES